MIEYRNYKLNLVKDCYSNNNNLAICCVKRNGEFFGDFTVNFEKLNDESLAYVDINNFYGIEELIKKYNLGEFTGHYRISGFCEYPLYKFNLKEIEKHIKKSK